MTSLRLEVVKKEMHHLSTSILCSTPLEIWNMMQPLSLCLHHSPLMEQAFELPQLQPTHLNFLELVLPFTLLDGEILKLMDQHLIPFSLLVFLMSTSPLVILLMEAFKQTFKFVLEELSDKILAKETVEVLSSQLSIQVTQLMPSSLVLFHSEEMLAQ